MIRRDIFSVKVWDDTIGDYCHIFMARSYHAAKRYVRGMVGRDMLSKIVHPAAWVVDSFVACGNTIDNHYWPFPINPR